MRLPIEVEVKISTTRGLGMDCNALVGEVDENFSKASCFDLAKCGFVDLLQSERKELHFEVGTDLNQMFGERVGKRSQQQASLLVNVFHVFFYIKSCRVGFNEDSGFSKRICRLVEVEEVDEEKEEKVDEE